MAKQSHKQKHTQTQTQGLSQSLSPHQVLMARLLELTIVEMEERVRSEVMENPALEQEEPERGDADVIIMGEDEEYYASADDYRSEDDVPDYNGWDYHSGGAATEEIPISSDLSFGETLLEQLGELPLSDSDKVVGEYLIGSLDEDGLLRKPLPEIVDELAIYYGVDADDAVIERILKMIQSFDPAGIAARSLQECLMIQLERSGDKESVAYRILENYYDDFAKKHWAELPSKLDISEDECRAAIAEVVRLNPRPGASLSESTTMSRQQIIPDFIIDIQGETISVQLNNGTTPQLRVSNDYMQMLDEQIKSALPEHKEAAIFLKQKIEAAKNFINAIEQREETLLRTMCAMVEKQKAFFLSGGDEAQLRPMILEDIARDTGYDVSTISRVSSSKYAQLPWCIMPLKYLFSDGVATNDGGEKSVRELYRAMQDLIDAEDKSNPLTDSELMERLQEQGYTMARRTVAKYREQLQIPVARLRKE